MNKKGNAEMDLSLPCPACGQLVEGLFNPGIGQGIIGFLKEVDSASKSVKYILTEKIGCMRCCCGAASQIIVSGKGIEINVY